MLFPINWYPAIYVKRHTFLGLRKALPSLFLFYKQFSIKSVFTLILGILIFNVGLLCALGMYLSVPDSYYVFLYRCLASLLIFVLTIYLTFRSSHHFLFCEIICSQQRFSKISWGFAIIFRLWFYPWQQRKKNLVKWSFQADPYIYQHDKKHMYRVETRSGDRWKPVTIEKNLRRKWKKPMEMNTKQMKNNYWENGKPQ